MNDEEHIEKLRAEILGIESTEGAASPELYYRLGELYNTTTQFELANDAYSKAIDSARTRGLVGHPDSSFSLGCNLANDSHLYNEARLRYQEAIRDARAIGLIGFPKASFALGSLLRDHFQMFAEADNYFEEAIFDARAMGQPDPS